MGCNKIPANIYVLMQDSINWYRCYWEEYCRTFGINYCTKLMADKLIRINTSCEFLVGALVITFTCDKLESDRDINDELFIILIIHITLLII